MKQQPLPHTKIVFVCTNERPPGDRVCCAACDAVAMHARLKELVKERGLKGKVRVSKAGCMDRCEQGPNIMLFPDNLWLSEVRQEDLEGIVDALAKQVQ